MAIKFNAKENRIAQSLLNRLRLAPEKAKSEEEEKEILIRSVEEDLQNLLNTRKPYTSLPSELTELEVSLVNYGIPDLTTINIYSGEQKQAFCQAVQLAIENYEPRLDNIKVELLEIDNQIELIFRLRISASLLVDPEPIPVSFDSSLLADTRLFDVKGQAVEEHSR